MRLGASGLRSYAFSRWGERVRRLPSRDQKKLGAGLLRDIGSLIIFAVIVIVAASSGASFMSGEWYTALKSQRGPN